MCIGRSGQRVGDGECVAATGNVLNNAPDGSETDFDTFTDEITTVTFDASGSFCFCRRQAR